jgi:hypothetical protein
METNAFIFDANIPADPNVLEALPLLGDAFNHPRREHEDGQN